MGRKNLTLADAVLELRVAECLWETPLRPLCEAAGLDEVREWSVEFDLTVRLRRIFQAYQRGDLT